MTAPGSLQKFQATVLKLMQNLSWRMSIQLHHRPSTMVRNLKTRNLPIQIRSYRKVRTCREKMNRLHQLKNQYPVDLFNSSVARLRSANAHLFDERSSEGHD